MINDDENFFMSQELSVKTLIDQKQLLRGQLSEGEGDYPDVEHSQAVAEQPFGAIWRRQSETTVCLGISNRTKKILIRRLQGKKKTHGY